MRRDTEALAAFPARTLGTAGHDEALAGLEARIREIPGVRVWAHTFPVVVPVTESAVLRVADGEFGGEHRVFPLWPAVSRLHATPAEGIRGRLVYVGDGALTNLPAATLRGQIAVMEMAGGHPWRGVWNAGAAAIVLLGSDGVILGDAHAHLLQVPVHVPRFYMAPGPLADALRRGAVPSGTLSCRSSWQPRTARNLYALVPARPGVPPRQAVIFCAPTDSMSVVPDQAPGADAAVDAALLVEAARRLAAEPGERPALFAFVDAFGINQLGVRRMLSALSVPPGEREEFLTEDRKLLREYEEHEALTPLLAGAGGLPALAQRRFRPLQRYVKDETAKEVTVIEYDLARLRLQVDRAAPDVRTNLEQRILSLSERRGVFNGAQAALLTGRPLSEGVRPTAEKLWEKARARMAAQKKGLEETLALHAGEDAIRREIVAALGLPRSVELPACFVLGVDLSDAGTAAGPCLVCDHLDVNETANAGEFRSWLNQVVREEADRLWPGRAKTAVDLGPFQGLDSPGSYNVYPVATLTSPAQSFGMPAMTWATLEGYRSRADTPNDTAAALDWDRLAPQVEATFALMRRVVARADFEPAAVGFRWWWRGVRGVVADRSVGEPVPRLPMEGYLVTLMPGNARGGGRAAIYNRPAVPGVRLHEFAFTGADGRYRFEALPARTGNGPTSASSGGNGAYRQSFVEAWALNPDGSFARAVDLNKMGRGVDLNLDVASRSKPLRAVVFTCEETSVLDLVDSRFLMRPSPTSSSLLDALRGGKPQRANFLMHNGDASCLLEPGSRWLLVLRLGATQNRMALLNMAEAPDAGNVREAMTGFLLGERLPSQPVCVAAEDYFRLNEKRLADYRRAGIRSQPIERVHEASRALLQEAKEAAARDDGAAAFQAGMGAMANEVRAYQAVRAVANDIVRAVIFLLLALVPFSFALERLVFACSHVYRQIAVTVAIFAVMTAILWSFHPAFRMSSQPLIIVMAFGIIFMSLLVMGVVYGKFEGGLREMRSGRAESSGASTSRSGVLASAVILGIANMRKRKLRTALTGTTVVLITFALLCFTSVSTYVSRREFPVNAVSPYTGVLLKQPAARAIPETLLPYLRALPGLRDRVVPRYWLCNTSDGQWRLHVRNPATGTSRSLNAALGLVPQEAELTGVDRVLPDWKRFAERGGCYLSVRTAEELGVKPGDLVQVAGCRFELVGTFDGNRMESEVADLDGQSLLPYDYSGIDRDQRKNLVNVDFDVLSTQVEGSQWQELGGALPHLPGDAVIVLPADGLRKMGIRDVTLRSVSLPLDSTARARETAIRLADRVAMPVYFGDRTEVHAVAVVPFAPAAPTSLFIPLLIAGLIIFNTMLNSIAERRREIHVYTSLGLAPVHVGVLFMAEALTYGLMGSIFGYIVGQGVATGLGKLGWLGGITLNYSGTQAVTTMGIVLAIVGLSSLAPAILAGRVAAPSEEMKWAVPEPQNDEIRDLLPFTVTRESAGGVIAFLEEHFDAHREGSIGRFTTDRLAVEREDAAGGRLPSLRATVWLSPYDLGVRQEARIVLRPLEGEGICEVAVVLTRETGPTRSWWRLNRVFLGDLRRQLLGWRKLKSDRVLAYMERAKRWPGGGSAEGGGS